MNEYPCCPLLLSFLGLHFKWCFKKGHCASFTSESGDSVAGILAANRTFPIVSQVPLVPCPEDGRESVCFCPDQGFGTLHKCLNLNLAEYSSSVDKNRTAEHRKVGGDRIYSISIS